MKILAFVDTHGNIKAIDRIVETAKKSDVDALICAGDVSIFEQNIESLIRKLASTKRAVLIIPGNHEAPKHLRDLCSKYKNIIYMNKAVLKIKDNKGRIVIFMGNEANGFANNDPQFAEWGRKVKKQVHDLSKGMKKRPILILITHAPPYKTKLDNLMGSRCGNKDIRRFIEEMKVNLAIAGHIHENSGKEDRIKNTRVVNPGPYGKIIEI